MRMTGLSSPGSVFDTRWHIDEVREEIRRVAQEARTEALENPGLLPMVNADLGIYKPILETFVELSNAEMEVYDAVSRACDTGVTADREHAKFSVQYIQSLGDDALKVLPNPAREQSKTRLTPGDFLWPLLTSVYWIILVSTEGWPLRELDWIPDIITDTSAIWFGVIVVFYWVKTIYKLIKRVCEIVNQE